MQKKIWCNLTGSSADTRGQSAEKVISSLNLTALNYSNSVNVSYKLKGFWHEKTPFTQEGFSLFEIPEAGFTTCVGYPMLAREGIFVRIPPNAAFDKIDIKIVDQKMLLGEYNFIPVPADVPENKKMKFTPNKTIYSLDAPYPQTPVEFVKMELVEGVPCVHFYVYPFQYHPKSKKVKALTNIDITVHFARMDSNEEYKSRRNLKSTSHVLESSDCDTSLVGNFNELVDQVDSEQKKRMLIITTADLKESLNTYKDVKSIKYDVSIILKEDIVLLYPNAKEADAIRNYILEQDVKTPISYLILGGNKNKIPIHERKSSGIFGKKFASDNYYCSEEDNPLPLFCVGRFPADTPEEMFKIADFAANYNYLSNDEHKTAIFTSYNQPQNGYEQCLEDIAKKMETSESNFTVTRCYDGKCSKEELIATINRGAGFINYRGHGDNEKWQSNNGLSVKDIPRLNVGNNIPHVLSIACSTNDIRKNDCFGALWVKKEKAISFLGASAPSFTLVNHVFTKFLWDALQKQEITTIGDAFVWATMALYKHESENTPRQVNANIFQYLLLGDPTADYMNSVT